MKRVFLFFAVLIMANLLMAQSLTFSGTSTAATVDLVVATNLNTGASLTFTGNQVFLKTTQTGIGTINGYSSIITYPNPSEGISTIEFSTPESSFSQLELINSLGQCIEKQTLQLNAGTSIIEISTPERGLYFLMVKTASTNQLVKLLSNQPDKTSAYITLAGNTNSTQKLKSTNTTELEYTPGDKIHFVVKAGIYSTSLTDAPIADKIYSVTFYDCTDLDNYTYRTVTIGTQVWMAENLKTSKYNNGTALPKVTDTNTWAGLTTPAYCWYNNDSATYSGTYGALYNWYSVSNSALCPLGWHVPSDAEWTILTDYLGGESIAGGKLKETGTIHWNSPNAGATNEIGFTALPGGYRSVSGIFNSIGSYGYWWSTTENSPNSPWYRIMFYDYSKVFRFYGNYKKSGYSIRCVRD